MNEGGGHEGSFPFQTDRGTFPALPLPSPHDAKLSSSEDFFSLKVWLKWLLKIETCWLKLKIEKLKIVETEDFFSLKVIVWKIYLA